MPIFPRYLRATADIPEEGITEGMLVAIDPRDPHPITSLRYHGTNVGRYLGYEADGKLVPLDGVIGLPRHLRDREVSPASQDQVAKPQAG